MAAVFLLITAAAASSAATIQFSGYTWRVRPAGTGGPGPNQWDPANVSVDSNGWLHLRLAQRDGQWQCAEVSTRERLGFGRYEFDLTGQVDRLDRNVVLGLFNYPTSDVGPDGTHEIDIEFARWGDGAAPAGNYTVWPATNALRQQTSPFAFSLQGSNSTHAFVWTSTNILFESREDLRESGTNRPLATWRFQPANTAAGISQKPMPVHLNLWCFKGRPPANGREVELVIRAFRFTPLGETR